MSYQLWTISCATLLWSVSDKKNALENAVETNINK